MNRLNSALPLDHIHGNKVSLSLGRFALGILHRIGGGGKGMLDRLKEIILEKSFQYSEKPIFKLAYAGKSNFYFNCKPTVLDPEGAQIVAQLVRTGSKIFQFLRLGGLS